MEDFAARQALIFLYCMLGGACIGLFFDVLRIIRRTLHCKAKGAATQLLDVLFWLVTPLFLFLLFFHVNDGALRTYQFLGALAGALLYFLLLSPLILRLSALVIGWLSKILTFVLRILFTPLRWVLRLLRRSLFAVYAPARSLTKSMRKIAGGVKASAKHLQKRIKRV